MNILQVEVGAKDEVPVGPLGSIGTAPQKE